MGQSASESDLPADGFGSPLQPAAGRARRYTERGMLSIARCYVPCGSWAMNPSALLDIRPGVAAALMEGRPVVALESTLIAHGLPWPLNLETAQGAEAAVRAEGAVPATIAV